MLPVRLPHRFRLIRELGRGGMGAVYEAKDDETGARVAIKTLPSADPVAIARFKQEFRALADLHHPNLVALGDLFCEDGQWAFSMDLIDGVDLLEFIWQEQRVLPDSLISEKETASVLLENLSPQPGRRASARVSVRPPGGGPPSWAFASIENKVRESFSQLAAGLAAIHAANIVHRDVKPSNVRVRSDGHVFLLDFGLAAEASSDVRLTRERAIVGTPGYIPPEQLRGARPSASSDLYSLGVALFEVLTGRLPFEGSAMQMLEAQERSVAPRVRSFVPDVADDIDDLCASLLCRDPSTRPSAAEVARVLPLRLEVAPRTGVQAGESVPPPFVGRKEHLEVLRDALSAVLAGRSASVLLVGESGIGKSYLARRFLASVQREHPEAVVIAGRCYENEAVPYNAWDSVIESFASYWLQLSGADAAELLPTQSAALVQTFPALLRVPAVSRASARAARNLDPHEIRTRAFSALRDVFVRTAQRLPLIVLIDDLQWADHDSLSLLGEVLREPSPPPILLLGTVRPLHDSSAVATALHDALPRGAVHCSVSQLAPDDAEDLARRLLSRSNRDLVPLAPQIAREADGHALFIAELVRHVATAGTLTPLGLSLSEALFSRVEELDPEARASLTILSLAARPVPEPVLLRAARVEATLGARALAALRVGHLSRVVRVGDEDWLETYHDRVRGAVASRIPADERAAAFRELALAFEESAYADAAMLTEFWGAAGDAERAAQHARAAGDRARDALAFDLAASFYTTALECGSHTPEQTHELLTLLAETLADAGRGKEAAAVYTRAVASAKDRTEALALEQKACDQLFRTGDLDAGFILARSILARVNIAWPDSRLRALLVLSTHVVALAVRGRRFKVTPESNISALELARLDVCQNVSMWLLMSDSLRSFAFQQMHMLHVLRSGEVGRISVAMSRELGVAGFRNGGRTRRALRRLEKGIARVKTVAELAGRPYERAQAEFSIGLSLAGACRPREGIPHMERSLAGFREECHGKMTEIARVQTWMFRACFYAGEYAKLSVRQPPALQESIDRRDAASVSLLRLGLPNFAWLIRDDLDGARVAAADAFEQWRASASATEARNWHAVICFGNIALYGRDARAAIDAIDEPWAELQRSGLRFFLPVVRFESSEQRARAHLAMAADRAADRDDHLSIAAKCARDVHRANVAYGPPMHDLLQAQVAFVSGDVVKSEAMLRRSIVGLERVDLAAHAAIARRALGLIVQGEEGEQLVDEGAGYLRSQSVENIGAICRCLAPGFDSLR